MTATGLTEKQEKLLIAATENNGRLDKRTADEVFDTDKHAKKAMKRLSKEGFADKQTEGVFRIKKFPSQLEDRLSEETREKLRA